MKRLIVRFAALSVVIVLGVLAVFQAQRKLTASADPSNAAAAKSATTPAGETPPNPAAAAPARYADQTPARASAGDPFASSRLIDTVSGPQSASASPPPSAYPPRRPAVGESGSDVANLPRRLSTAIAPPPDPSPGSGALPAAYGERSATSEDRAASDRAATRQPGDRSGSNDPIQIRIGGAGEVPNSAPMDRYADASRYPSPASDPSRPAATDHYPAPSALPGGGLPPAPVYPPTAPRTAPSADPRYPSPYPSYASDSHPAAIRPPAELPRDDALRAIPRDGASFAAPMVNAAMARPGSRQLDGPQSPQVTVQKSAPHEIQIGKPATFKIVVRNSGSVAAQEVVVYDAVPEGTSLISSSPRATVSGAQLSWSLGKLEPGEEKTLSVQLMPQAEGEIGSVARVGFQAEASARTIATRPELVLDVSGPRRVMTGENVALSIKVSNPGTGAAGGVVLYETLPPQLKHSAGKELEFDIGVLKPKESRLVELTLTAAAAGRVAAVITARGEGSLSAKGQTDLEVIAPALEVSLAGPRRRFLERQATYTVSVSNPGTAPAKDVELVSRLPKGLKFVSANNSGRYDQQTNAVYWSLAELPEGQTGSVKLVTLPIEAGEQKLLIEGRADRNLSQTHEETIEVDGVASVLFEVSHTADPIEVGGETSYEIRVVNQGTKSAGNVRLSALVPPELKALAADGATRGTIEGGRVLFEPLARLAPKTDTTYRIRIQGISPGDQRVRIQLQSDDMTVPLTKEESTRVYADR